MFGMKKCPKRAVKWEKKKQTKPKKPGMEQYRTENGEKNKYEKKLKIKSRSFLLRGGMAKWSTVRVKGTQSESDPVPRLAGPGPL